MRIVFDYIADQNSCNILDWVAAALEKNEKYEVIKRRPTLQDDLYFKNKDVRMYKNILDYCESIDADKLLFGGNFWGISHLLNELEIRENFYTKIMFTVSFREIYRSFSRANAYKRLLERKEIDKMIISSMAGTKTLFPPNWEKLNVDRSKYVLFSDPLNEDPKIFRRTKKEGRERFGIPDNKFVVGFLGSTKYVRGFDIFVNSLSKIDKDIFVAINTTYTEDMNFMNIDWSFKERENLYLRDGAEEGFMSFEDLGLFYSAVDLMVIPLRKQYIFGSTGLPPQVATAKRLMIMPDMYPYDYLVNEYKLGETFIPENSESLAKTIMKIYLDKEKYYDLAKFEEYEDTLTNLEDFATVVSGNKKRLKYLKEMSKVE